MLEEVQSRGTRCGAMRGAILLVVQMLANQGQVHPWSDPKHKASSVLKSLTNSEVQFTLHYVAV